MSKYTKEHYEDVAEIMARHRHPGEGNREAEGCWEATCADFADLFAADNPQRCIICDQRKDTGSPCDDLSEHSFEGGFDRELFLAACGLTTKEVEHGL